MADLRGVIVIIAPSLFAPFAFFKFRKAIIAEQGCFPALLFIIIPEVLVSLLGITLLFIFWEGEGAAISTAEFSKEILIFTMVLYAIFIPIVFILKRRLYCV